MPSTDTYGFPGATGFISANGTANGIVWEVEKNTNQLRAYSAANVSTELYTERRTAPAMHWEQSSNSASRSWTTATSTSAPATVSSVYGILNPPTTAPTAPTNLAAAGISTSQVQLTWTRTSTNESGFYVERSTDDVNFTQVGLADAGATAFIDSNGLSAEHDLLLSHPRLQRDRQFGLFERRPAAETLLGIAGLWADRDIGTPNATGGASFANNTFTVSGSGNDIFNTSDNFHFVYQPLDAATARSSPKC